MIILMTMMMIMTISVMTKTHIVLDRHSIYLTDINAYDYYA